MTGEFAEMTDFLINLTEQKPYTFITICILIVAFLTFYEIRKIRHKKS
ncbi:hypothetical protein [Cellulophaga omnivescoria]|nr:hypothetical protein [Cellulophaga omnivescoria]WBU89713.1 hypothetical protein PBN93_01545 [Cellulophaga omnivescoria]WKB81735.1 hypothetical protein QYR09_01540 [Cellulophaga lytica]